MRFAQLPFDWSFESNASYFPRKLFVDFQYVGIVENGSLKPNVLGSIDGKL